MNTLRYDCRPYQFEPHLSILDVLMWCSTDEIGTHLRNLRFAASCHDQY